MGSFCVFPPCLSLLLNSGMVLVYQRSWEGCTRQVFVCFGEGGLQLAPVMCKSQWVRQHSVQEESCLIDWDAHYHRHPLRSSTPPPCRPLVSLAQGAHVPVSIFFKSRPALLHTRIQAVMHIRACA